jgi:serine/threonine protein kinase
METSINPDPVIAILQEALQQQPEEREAYVRSACDGDHELYRKLADALQWEDRMGNFLLESLVDFTLLVRPFEPGQTIGDGRFEILREIGEGGMGVVYQAFDRKLQQQIAIKAAKPGFQRLLSPELKAALKVRHQNICLIKEIHTAQTDYGEVDFLAMELLEGETLSAHLAKSGKLSHEEALAIACQVCAGLAEAHRSGIIHRDLKSGNVILCNNEDGSRRAVITDFGLAGGTAITSGEVAGTPAYMAPELWRGDQSSKASDVYALGVMLYETIAGRRPHQADESSDDSGTTCPAQRRRRADKRHRPRWCRRDCRRHRRRANPRAEPHRQLRQTNAARSQPGDFRLRDDALHKRGRGQTELKNKFARLSILSLRVDYRMNDPVGKRRQ